MNPRIFTILIFLLLVHVTWSKKILFLAFNPEESHKNVFLPIVKELLNKGHQVISIISNRLLIRHVNYTEFPIVPFREFTFGNLSHSIDRGECSYFRRHLPCLNHHFRDLVADWSYGKLYSQLVFESTYVQRFLEEKRFSFDLVISQLAYQELSYAFAAKYMIPLVLLSVHDIEHPVFESLGTFSIWSHIPLFWGIPDRSETFADKFVNRLLTYLFMINRKLLYLGKINGMTQHYFKRYIPPITQIESSTALVLYNSLQIMSQAQLPVPGLIDISGIHMKPLKPLAEGFQTFLDEAENGVIYLSFGSTIKGSLIPEHKIRIFIEVFEILEMKVIWKHNDPEYEFPKNVLVKENLPQNEILAHKNVKLFITHGSVPSIQEAIYHAVPMIVIPFYGDQFHNAMKVEQAEIGKILRMIEFNPERLLSYIQKILNDVSYQENIGRLSDIMKHTSEDPLKKAIFWIEHVLRRKGADHLKPTVSGSTWYECFFLDYISMFIVCRKIFAYWFKKPIAKVSLTLRSFKNIIFRRKPKIE